MKRSLLGVLISVYTVAAFGWGHTGHEKLAEVATTLTTNGQQFWLTNKTNIGILANVPDVVWKSLPTANQEKPTHFFQPDSYFSNPSEFNLFPHDYQMAASRYTVAALNVSGTATWRAGQLFKLAVAAFKKGDVQNGLVYAGTMCHYIGDLSQPLHVTKNYDGQETGDPGIHAFFETKNIQSADVDQLVAEVTTQASALLKKSTFTDQSSGDVVDTTFNEIDRAYAEKDTVIQNDLKLGRKGAGAAAQLKLAEERLADGAATLSIVLSKIWTDAGSPSIVTTQQVTIDPKPAWVQPSYSSQHRNSMPLAVEDDCEQ